MVFSHLHISFINLPDFLQHAGSSYFETVLGIRYTDCYMFSFNADFETSLQLEKSQVDFIFVHHF